MIKIYLEGIDNPALITEVLALFSPSFDYKQRPIEIKGPNEADYKLIFRLEAKEEVDLAAQTYIFQTRVIKNAKEQENEQREVTALNYKEEFRLKVYAVLEEIFQLRYPFGALTGVRPSQLAYRLYQEHKSLAQIRLLLQERWQVSQEKIELIIQVMLRENEILEKLGPEDSLAYVGIPFCPSRCSYCSFITKDAILQNKHLSSYVLALAQEIRSFFAKSSAKLRSIYIGGGTPSVLNEADLEFLLTEIRKSVDLRADYEFTFEAGRADTINQKKLSLLQDYGVTRLCINPQTMQDETLKRVARQHQVREVVEAFELAKSLGFQDINMDLIWGLPGEDEAMFADSLEQVISLDPSSISIHALAAKRTANLFPQQKEARFKRQLPQESLILAYQKAQARLARAGYLAYYMYRQKQAYAGLENIGFAKGDHYCLYNVAMMSDRFPIFAFGAGSSSKKLIGNRLQRLHNPKDILMYNQGIKEISQKKLAFFGLAES